MTKLITHFREMPVETTITKNEKGWTISNLSRGIHLSGFEEIGTGLEALSLLLKNLENIRPRRNPRAPI